MVYRVTYRCFWVSFVTIVTRSFNSYYRRVSNSYLIVVNESVLLRVFWHNYFTFFITNYMSLGNSNQNGIVKNNLQEFECAKFIRFKPTAYSGFKALRVEVYGILLTKGIYLFLFLSPPETKMKSYYSNYLWKTSLGNCAELANGELSTIQYW